MAADNFTAQKLAAIDRALYDSRVSHLDFRVLYYLASATDRETRLAKRKQKTIAAALNIKIRTVQLSLGRLHDFGYIIFETKEGGTYVNSYRLVLLGVNGSSALDNEKANSNSPFVKKRRIKREEKTYSGVQKDESSFVHDLPFNSHNIPSRLRTPFSANTLGSLGPIIRGRIGDDLFNTWFGDVQIAGDSSCVGTLVCSTKFRCHYVKSKFEYEILACWRSLDPLKERVEFVVAPR